MFSSRRKNILNIFFEILVFKIFIEKIKNQKNSMKMKFDRKIENYGFQKFHRKNQKFRNFYVFDFFDENFENQNFEKIFSKYFFAEMKKCFWSRFFSTVWTKSLDSPKTVQSTRGSSSMPRQGIAFRGCL